MGKNDNISGDFLIDIYKIPGDIDFGTGDG